MLPFFILFSQILYSKPILKTTFSPSHFRFRGTPYKATVNEDTPVGTTIFSALEAHDTDLVGDILEVRCLTPPDLCRYFDIVPRARDTDIDMFRGAIALRQPFNYRERQIYQIQLGVFDGRFNDTADLIFTVIDVQNMPPIFEGSLTGIVNEDDPVGSVVMKVTAKEGSFFSSLIRPFLGVTFFRWIFVSVAEPSAL